MKRCFYEVLGLSQHATDDDIKKSYRRLALKCHPDKNPGDEEAHVQFLEIQEAYETLSDPQERAWYNNHKDQILRNSEEGESDGTTSDPSATRINIYRWFRRDCFCGFSESVDKNGGLQCFYTVYRNVFDIIADEEVKRSENPESFACQEFKDAPTFGTSTSGNVHAFYRFWSRFSSQRDFGFAEKWKLRDAPNRFVRRHMETENKKMRREARQSFNESVLALVEYIKKRDPRLVAARLEKAIETKRLNEEKAEKKLRLEQERQRNREIARENEMRRHEELRKEKEAASATGGQVFLDNEEDESDTSDNSNNEGKTKRKNRRDGNVAYVCEACKKTFKSEAQFRTHEKSKKHLVALAELVRRLDEEQRATEQGEGDNDSSENDSSENDSSENDSENGINIDDKDEVGSRDDGENKEELNDGEHEALESDSSDMNTDAEVNDRKDLSSESSSRSNGNKKPSRQRRSSSSGTSSDSDSDSSDDISMLGRLRQLRLGRPKGQRDSLDSSVGQHSDKEQEDVHEETVVENTSIVAITTTATTTATATTATTVATATTGEEVEEKVIDDRGEGADTQGKEGDKNKVDKQSNTKGAVSSRKPKNKKEKPINTTAEQTVEKCSVCAAEFSSRNQLFKHIKKTNHAVVKEVVNSERTKSQQKKQQRGKC